MSLSSRYQLLISVEESCRLETERHREAIAGLHICGSEHHPRKEKERPAVPVQAQKENLNMEKFYKEKEGKPENEGTAGDEGYADEERSNTKVKAAREGQQEGGGEPEEEGHPRDEDKSGKQGKSSEEEPQATTASESRAAEKRPAEDYVPRKAKRKTDRGTDDSPKDSRGDLQDRHLSSVEMMRECADMSRAQEELRKKQKMGGCHWMQRDAQDAFAPRGQRGVRGMRGGGRGQKDLEDVPFV